MAATNRETDSMFLDYAKNKIENENYSIDEPLDDEEYNFNTLLMEAVHEEDLPAVKYLVTNGASVNLIHNGRTALTSYNPYMGGGADKIIEILEYLLDNEALFLQDLNPEYYAAMPDERAELMMENHARDVNESRGNEERNREVNEEFEAQTLADMEAIRSFFERAMAERVYFADVSLLGSAKRPELFKYDKMTDIRTLKKLISAIVLGDRENKTKFDLIMPMAPAGKTKKNTNANKKLNLDRIMSDYVGNRFNSVHVKVQIVMSARTGFGGRRRTHKLRQT
jgi:hypothetical protein